MRPATAAVLSATELDAVQIVFGGATRKFNLRMRETASMLPQTAVMVCKMAFRAMTDSKKSMPHLPFYVI